MTKKTERQHIWQNSIGDCKIHHFTSLHAKENDPSERDSLYSPLYIWGLNQKKNGWSCSYFTNLEKINLATYFPLLLLF